MAIKCMNIVIVMIIIQAEIVEFILLLIIVVGIKDSSLLERMQLDNTLILEKEKATKMVRQSEMTKLQQSEMRRLPNE